jgi:hypothetical protein
MKVMMIEKTRGNLGSYGGVVNLSLGLGSLKLSGYGDGTEYILSLRDELWVTCLPKKDGKYPDYTGSFQLGSARALLMHSLDNGGRNMVKISIEGTDTTDFVDLYNTVYARLGVPHEHIPTPTRRLEPPSFVRGIRNDLHELGEVLSNRWQLIKESMRSRKTT